MLLNRSQLVIESKYIIIINHPIENTYGFMSGLKYINVRNFIMLEMYGGRRGVYSRYYYTTSCVGIFLLRKKSSYCTCATFYCLPQRKFEHYCQTIATLLSMKPMLILFSLRALIDLYILAYIDTFDISTSASYEIYPLQKGGLRT